MAVRDPKAWVKNVERLYRANDADGVSNLYTADSITIFGSRVLSPQEVHAHPKEWFSSLIDYQIERIFRASNGDIVRRGRREGSAPARRIPLNPQ